MRPSLLFMEPGKMLLNQLIAGRAPFLALLLLGQRFALAVAIEYKLGSPAPVLECPSSYSSTFPQQLDTWHSMYGSHCLPVDSEEIHEPGEAMTFKRGAPCIWLL